MGPGMQVNVDEERVCRAVVMQHHEHFETSGRVDSFEKVFMPCRVS